MATSLCARQRRQAALARATGARAASLAAAAWLAAAATAAAAAPALDVRAPAELAAVAAEVERLGSEGFARALRLTGLADLRDAGAPIVVRLEAAGSPAERAAAPWISGWADGAAGVVVLLPSRVARYPYDGLAPLLRHEVAHVLVARAAGGRPVPRWFDEGIAMAAGRDWDLGDRARVALAVLGDGSLPIARLDRAFAGGESEVRSAYALAGDLVRELTARFGDEAPGAILARVAAGERFRDAFAAATGMPTERFERDYWARRTLWDRWVPIVSSSALLWSAVALLVVAAHRRKRRRAAELRARWELEELVAAASREDDEPS